MTQTPHPFQAQFFVVYLDGGISEPYETLGQLVHDIVVGYAEDWDGTPDQAAREYGEVWFVEAHEGDEEDVWWEIPVYDAEVRDLVEKFTAQVFAARDIPA